VGEQGAAAPSLAMAAGGGGFRLSLEMDPLAFTLCHVLYAAAAVDVGAAALSAEAAAFNVEVVVAADVEAAAIFACDA